MTSRSPQVFLPAFASVCLIWLSSCATKDGEVAGSVSQPAETPVAEPIEGAQEELAQEVGEKLAQKPEAPEAAPAPEKPAVAKAEEPPAKPVEPEKSPTELAKLAENKVNWSSSQSALKEACAMSGKAADKAPKDAKIALQHARHALRLAQTESGIDRPAAVAKEALSSMEAAGIAGEANDAVAAYYHASLSGLVMQAQGLGAAGKLPKLEAEFKRSTGAPGTEQGGPWRAIGMLYLKAPPWPTGIGDIELALENLEKAAKSYGGFPHNHICLARAYADDGSMAEAKQSLDRAENLLASGNWGALETGWRREIAEIRKLLG